MDRNMDTFTPDRTPLSRVDNDDASSYGGLPVSDLLADFFSQVEDRHEGNNEYRTGTITELLNDSEIDNSLVYSQTESGRVTTRITSEGRERSGQIAAVYPNPQEGLQVLIGIRDSLVQQGNDPDGRIFKAQKKVINSAIGKLRYQSNKENVGTYLKSIGVADESLGLNAADIAALNSLAEREDTFGVYEYLEERARYNATRVASMLSVEASEVSSIVSEMQRFLGAEFGAANTDPQHGLDEIITNLAEAGNIDSCVNIRPAKLEGQTRTLINARGRRVADQILFELVAEFQRSNFSPESNLTFIADIVDERIEMLKESNSSEAEALIRILQSVKGKAQFKLWRKDFIVRYPYPLVDRGIRENITPKNVNHISLSAVNGSASESKTNDGVDDEGSDVALMQEGLLRATDRDISSVAESLGVDPSAIVSVVEELAVAAAPKERKHLRWSKFRTKVALAIGAVAVGIAAFAAPVLAKSSSPKQAAKDVFYGLNEKLGDEDCEALVAYIDDSGDYAVLPKVLESWIPGGVTCRDIAPPGFVFIDDFQEEIVTGEDNLTENVIENTRTESVNSGESTLTLSNESSILGNIEQGERSDSGSSGNAVLIGEGMQQEGEDVVSEAGESETPIGTSLEEQESHRYHVEDTTTEEYISIYEPVLADTIILSPEILAKIQAIDSNQEAITFLSELTPEHLSTRMETDITTGVDYLYYSLPEAIASNPYIQMVLGTEMVNFMGQTFPDGVIAITNYFPENAKAVFTPALRQGQKDYAQMYYNTDFGSLIKGAGGVIGYLLIL